MPANFGVKLPLDTHHILKIQRHLYDQKSWRDLAMFMLGIDSLLRGCDLLKLRVQDVQQGSLIRSRLVTKQQKTGRVVESWLSKPTREALAHWIACSGKGDNPALARY